MSTAYAGIIDFTNQSYQPRYINITDDGCMGEFGEILQNNINVDPLYTILSADYDTDFNIGTTTATITDRNGQLISTQALFPLGIADIFAFGYWILPSFPVAINQHDYFIYGVGFQTTGSSNHEWIINGFSSLLFLNPNGLACTVNSRIVYTQSIYIAKK